MTDQRATYPALHRGRPSKTLTRKMPNSPSMISRIMNEPFSLCKDNFAFHILLGPRHSIRTVCRDEIQPVCGRQIKRITELRRTRIKRRIHLDLGQQLLSASGTKNGHDAPNVPNVKPVAGQQEASPNGLVRIVLPDPGAGRRVETMN